VNAQLWSPVPLLLASPENAFLWESLSLPMWGIFLKVRSHPGTPKSNEWQRSCTLDSWKYFIHCGSLYFT
jgi:hypothetical protein